MLIKSGADEALALGMANVIIRDNLVDRDFLKRKTTAAYLVREDTGKYLCAGEAIPGARFDEFVYADAQGKLHAIGKVVGKMMLGQIANNANLKDEDKIAQIEALENAGNYESEPDFDADVTVDGVRCRTTFGLLRDHVAKWTPESQEELTGVPAATCEQMAREYVAATPALIFMYNGFRCRNATQSCRAIYLLTYLSGNCGRRGGSIIVGGDDHHPSSRLEVKPIYFPDPNIYKGDQQSMIEILRSFEDPTYEGQQYKAFINPFANPLLNWANRNLWKERVLPNLELVVSFVIRMSDTARYADYVLPETTSFERHELLSGPDDCITLCEPAIEPCGEARTCADIWAGIASRIGVGQYFDKTLEEWCKFKLNFLTRRARLVAAASIPCCLPFMRFSLFESLRCDAFIDIISKFVS